MTEQHQQRVQNWYLKGQVIAIDGKSLRHSFDTATAKATVHMVSAWASETRLVLV